MREMEGHAMSVATKTSREMPGTYAGLIREFPLRPIRSSAELRKATRLLGFVTGTQLVLAR